MVFVWNIVKKIVSGFLTIITLLSFFLNINTVQEFIKNEAVKNVINNVYFNTCIVVLFLVAIVFYGISYKKTKAMTVNAAELNHEFFHDLRNFYFSNKRYKQKDENYDYAVKQETQILCRYLCDFLKLKYNKSFNICIKLIEIPSSVVTSSIKEMRVNTLCREGKDRIKREQLSIDPVKVCDDTSYMTILAQGAGYNKSYFVCRNLFLYCLMKVASKNQYKPNFRSFYKKYLSTIVMPIRISTEHLSAEHIYGGVNTNVYQVFGFLCLDYKWFLTKKEAELICEDIKAFADSFYFYFDDVHRFSKTAYNTNATNKS